MKVKEFKFTFEYPYDRGYIVIPKSFIKKAERYTKRFNVSPNIIDVNNRENRRLKALILAIDKLSKFKKKDEKISIDSIAELLNIPSDYAQEILDDAEKHKFIKKVNDDSYVIVLNQKKEKDKKIEDKKPKREKAKMTKFIELYANEFEMIFKRKPKIQKEDIFANVSTVKEYDMDDLEFFVKGFLRLKDEFLKESGYLLRFLPSKINKIIIQNKMFKDIRRDKKIYKEEDYSEELSDEQLKYYLIGKLKGKWSKNEEWAKNYEIELEKRNITKDSLTNSDYKNFEEKFDKRYENI